MASTWTNACSKNESGSPVGVYRNGGRPGGTRAATPAMRRRLSSFENVGGVRPCSITQSNASPIAAAALFRSWTKEAAPTATANSTNRDRR